MRDMVEQVGLLGEKSGAVFATRTAASSWRATSRLKQTQGSHIHHFGAEPGKCLLANLSEPSDFVVLWSHGLPAYEGDNNRVAWPYCCHLCHGVERRGRDLEQQRAVHRG